MAHATLPELLGLASWMLAVIARANHQLEKFHRARAAAAT